MATRTPSGNRERNTTPEGFWVHPHGLHTSLPVVVRRVRFIRKPRGPQVVEVTATIGESEDNTEAIRFHMTHEQALAADIIGRRR